MTSGRSTVDSIDAPAPAALQVRRKLQQGAARLLREVSVHGSGLLAELLDAVQCVAVFRDGLRPARTLHIKVYSKAILQQVTCSQSTVLQHH